VAPVGAVVAVIADGTAASVPPPAEALSKLAPPSAAAPASRPAPVAASVTAAQPTAAAPVKLDPFFEVRTPQRNYGPARLAGGRSVTPLARRLAAEGGIDLATVSPSGPHGRIVARDVESAARAAPKAAPRPAAATAPGVALATEPSAEEVKAIYRNVPFQDMPLDGMRRIIATRLVQAKQTIPHFYLTADVEIGRLITLREEANAAVPKDNDGKAAFRLSLNDLIIKAWAGALQRVPAANAVWAQDRILRLQHCDIAVAVALEGGLITPVIRRAEVKSLSAISNEMKDMTARARERKLKPDEYQGGSSTISNLGMYGVREFSAIINPPQATVLAVGAARRQAVEKEDGGVAFARVLSVTLSCDHRVVDGALGAELLAAFKSFIEQPVTMLV
jgi:pyruvate dehydrogenase E2 component (dihydrolipoamide acetyltransferase)